MRKRIAVLAAATVIGCGGSDSTAPTPEDIPKPGVWNLVSVDGFSLPHQFGLTWDFNPSGPATVSHPVYAVGGRIDVTQPCCSELYTMDSVQGQGSEQVDHTQVTFLEQRTGVYRMEYLEGHGEYAETAYVSGLSMTLRSRREWGDTLFHDYQFEWDSVLPSPFGALEYPRRP
jgi:hypothetical protein